MLETYDFVSHGPIYWNNTKANGNVVEGTLGWC